VYAAAVSQAASPTTSSEAPSAVAPRVVAPDPRGLARAFALTWLSYASYYLGRKGLSVGKTAIYKALGDRALVGVDTAYLAMYAVGQYLSGAIGDRLGARRLVGFGMLVSAGACVLFGLSGGWLLFLAAMCVNGLAQASGWPGNVKAMAEWVPPERRGAVMGLWSTCYQVGGIVATAVAVRFLAAWGWRWAFIGPAILIAAVGVSVLLLLRPGPLVSARLEEKGAHANDDPEDVALRARIRAARQHVLTSRAVWSYGASYFCIKLIRYSLLLWLPFYLETALGYARDSAGYFSTSFEIGGVFGTIGLGLLSDRLRHVPRSIFAAVSLVGLSGALYVYVEVGASSHLYNFLGMALVGALLFGPDALLSGAAAQDAGGAYAAALAAGVVNGLGSIGGVMQELVTRTVSERWGWSALFHVFLGLALLAALSLVPTFRGKGTHAEAVS